MRCTAASGSASAHQRTARFLCRLELDQRALHVSVVAEGRHMHAAGLDAEALHKMGVGAAEASAPNGSKRSAGNGSPP